MNFKLSRASSNLAVGVSHATGVLAFVIILDASDGERKNVVFGHDLDTIGHGIANGFVVFHPCRCQARELQLGGA